MQIQSKGTLLRQIQDNTILRTEKPGRNLTLPKADCTFENFREGVEILMQTTQASEAAKTRQLDGDVEQHKNF